MTSKVFILALDGLEYDLVVKWHTVYVSGRGALPEVVGDAGIVIKNPLNVGAWINSINRLRSDDVLYRKMREKTIKQAEKFRFEAQYEKFRNILKYLVS